MSSETDTCSIEENIRAAVESGIREVLIPVDNRDDAVNLSRAILDDITITPVSTIAEVLEKALVKG